MKITIAIPTYEYNGLGWNFLTDLLNSIHRQSYSDYNVIVSDQSSDSQIKNIVNYYSDLMDIKWIDATDIKRGVSSNLNNSIKKSDGDIVKLMCGDDFFIDSNALVKIKNSLDGNEKWCLMGCLHCRENIFSFYDRMIPRYHDKIHLGANTISGPSVLSLKVKEYFDENLCMLADCEIYKRLYMKYGEPSIIQDPLICNRMHNDQAQKNFSSLLEKEKIYCTSIYGE